MKFKSRSDETHTVELLHRARMKNDGTEVVVYYNENNGKTLVQDVAGFKEEFEEVER